MPEIAIKPEDSRRPQGGQRHRGCLRSPSRIGGSLEEASDIEDVRRSLSSIARRLNEAKKHRGCPRSLSRIARRLNEAEQHRGCLRLLLSSPGSHGSPDEAKDPRVRLKKPIDGAASRFGCNARGARKNPRVLEKRLERVSAYGPPRGSWKF
jgi:hypothetical protein